MNVDLDGVRAGASETPGLAAKILVTSAFLATLSVTQWGHERKDIWTIMWELLDVFTSFFRDLCR